MQHPRAHRFLTWVGPSLVVLAGGFITLVAALAPTYPGVKKWGEDWFTKLEPIVTAPWFLLLCVILLLGYSAALVWTSQPVSEHERIRRESLKRKQDVVLGLINPQRETDYAEATRKNELAAKRAQTRHSLNDWIPFHEALRYLVYQSQWGANQPAVKEDKEFDRLVGSEVRERLARGDVAARGKLGIESDALQRATEPIPAEFWVTAFLQPYGEIALADDNRSVAAKSGGGGPAYRCIILRKTDVESVWPRRTGEGLPPLAFSVEDIIAKTGLEESSPADEFSEEWSWQAAKQEGRIKVERDKPLGEALAYAGLGRWGARFIDAAAQGIGTANVPLKKFEQLAYDGRLRVWGKSERHRDLYEEIPREHWKNNQVEWFDLLRGEPRTEPRGQVKESPYYDLMVSRAEFEDVLPYIKPA